MSRLPILALAIVISPFAYCQTPTVTTIASGVPAVAWHNVLPPLGDGTAWECGGQPPGSYTGSWGLYQTCTRFNLSTGAVVSSSAAFGFGYGHSPAFQLSDGRIVTVGGQGQFGTQFQALDETQEWQPSAPTTQTFQHVLNGSASGAGYDLAATMLTPTLMFYAGGHGGTPAVAPATSWARSDSGTIDFSTSPPTVTRFSGIMQGRVYATIHPLSSTSAILIGGWNYADQTIERRNLDTIESVDANGKPTPFPQRLTSPTRYHSSQAIPGTSLIVAFGGTADPSAGRPAAIGNTNIIDTALGTVRAGLAMPHPGYHMQSWTCTIAGKVYVYAFAGQSGPGTPRMVLEGYDVANDNWPVSVALTEPSVDHDRITAVSGPDVWVLGGEDPTIPAPTSWLTHFNFGTGAVCTRG